MKEIRYIIIYAGGILGEYSSLEEAENALKTFCFEKEEETKIFRQTGKIYKETTTLEEIN